MRDNSIDAKTLEISETNDCESTLQASKRVPDTEDHNIGCDGAESADKQASPPTTPKSSIPNVNTDQILPEYDEKHLWILLEQLYDIRDKWVFIGEQFGLSSGDLESYSVQHQNKNDHCLRAVIRKRFNNNGPITACEVSKILGSSTVGAQNLAGKFADLENRRNGIGQTMDIDITEVNVLHCIKRDIADEVFPYTQFKRPYGFAADIPFAIFILLQILTVVDSGVPQNITLGQSYVNKAAFFVLYTLLMIVTPSVCYAQLCKLGTMEKMFLRSEHQVRTRSTYLRALGLEMESNLKERRLTFDPVNFISQLKFLVRLNIKAFDIKGFQVLIHALVFPVCLYFLGVFHNSVTDNPHDQSLWQTAQRYGVQVMEVWECVAVTIILFLSGTMKDLYCIENHAASLHSEIPASEKNMDAYKEISKKIFVAIRNRWYWFDCYALFLTIVFFILTLTLVSFGEPFFPNHSPIKSTHTWNVVTLLVILVQFGGSSANRIFKILCLLSYLVFPFFLSVAAYLDKDETKFLPDGFNLMHAPGNVSLLLYSTQSVSLINWLLCLCRCHFRQNNPKNQMFVLCLVAIVVVILCLLFTGAKEIPYMFNNENCCS